ncbi:hypothetical protein B0H19DRAFT_1379597 [Mycena capillaripes]|nr:hypothetical protein B0H19DRAFT_1379597 [Mycena capillaripes]
MILRTVSVNRLQKSVDCFFLPRLLSPTMAVRRGRPPKGAKRNISGLKNQSRQPSLNKTADNSSDSDYSDSEALDLAELDSLAYLEVDSDHSDSDNEANWDEIAQEKFQDCLVALMIQNEEDRRDAGDADWIPSRQEAEAKRSAKDKETLMAT